MGHHYPLPLFPVVSKEAEDDPIAYMVEIITSTFGREQEQRQVIDTLRTQCPIECISIALSLRNLQRGNDKTSSRFPWEQRVSDHLEAVAEHNRKCKNPTRKELR